MKVHLIILFLSMWHVPQSSESNQAAKEKLCIHFYSKDKLPISGACVFFIPINDLIYEFKIGELTCDHSLRNNRSDENGKLYLCKKDFWDVYNATKDSISPIVIGYNDNVYRFNFSVRDYSVALYAPY
jgi:hypothetical protein